jgi:hypothetical protein
MFSRMFRRDLKLLSEKICARDGFAFARFGKDQWDLMKLGEDEHASEDETLLAQDLLAALQHQESDYAYGLGCSCCEREARQGLMQQCPQPASKISMSSLIFNANYQTFKMTLQSLDESVILLADIPCTEQHYPFAIAAGFAVADDVTSDYAASRASIIEAAQELAKSFTKKLFFVGLPPFSPVLVHHMYQTNPSNRYIDVGSALDEWTHGELTADYQRVGTHESKHVCSC